jgi:hypothetical protein
MNTKGLLEPPPNTFLSPLLELRDYYSHLVEEYERLFIQARSQLDHVEALLLTWTGGTRGNEQMSRLEASEDTRVKFLSPEYTTEIDLLVEPEAENLELDHSPRTAPVGKLIRGQEVPMLPQYASLSRVDAIKIVLQEHLGTVCHIDFIVRSLYGELESSLFKVVKGRVQSSLTHGRERGCWAAIPNEPGCYTLDLSSLASTRGNSTSIGAIPKKKKPLLLPKSKIVPMLRTFEGQFLIDAITSLLGQNPGRIFSVADVINGIYGELDSQQHREVKNKVLNELSRGHRTGRFSRVPDKIGFYTWDVNNALAN